MANKANLTSEQAGKYWGNTTSSNSRLAEDPAPSINQNQNQNLNSNTNLNATEDNSDWLDNLVESIKEWWTPEQIDATTTIANTSNTVRKSLTESLGMDFSNLGYGDLIPIIVLTIISYKIAKKFNLSGKTALVSAGTLPTIYAGCDVFDINWLQWILGTAAIFGIIGGTIYKIGSTLKPIFLKYVLTKYKP